MSRSNFRVIPEMIPEKVRNLFDYEQQERFPVGSAGNRHLHIRCFCPNCEEWRWVPQSVARRKKTPYCFDCKNQLTNNRREGIGKGWFIDSSGYKIVNVRRSHTEQADHIKNHLTPKNARQNSYWFAEHRVIALLAWGSRVIKPGILVRHLDGNKTNNEINNLAPGSVKDNNMDHKKALAEMAYWRSLALTALSALNFRNPP